MAVLSLICIVWHTVCSVEIVARRRVRLPSCVLFFGEKFCVSLVDLWENTSLASPLDARASAQSRLRGFNAASTHSSSAAPAVLAPTELFTCQVVGSSLVSSSMGFRYCHGSFCWDFRIVKVCVCGRGSAIARCFGRHSCSPALEAPLIARMAAHTPFPTWTLRNSLLNTSNNPVRHSGGPELRQRQHM